MLRWVTGFFRRSHSAEDRYLFLLVTVSGMVDDAPYKTAEKFERLALQQCQDKVVELLALAGERGLSKSIKGVRWTRMAEGRAIIGGVLRKFEVSLDLSDSMSDLIPGLDTKRLVLELIQPSVLGLSEMARIADDKVVDRRSRYPEIVARAHYLAESARVLQEQGAGRKAQKRATEAGWNAAALALREQLRWLVEASK